MSILTIAIAVSLLWIGVLSVVVALCSVAGRADRRDRGVVRRTSSSAAG